MRSVFRYHIMSCNVGVLSLDKIKPDFLMVTMGLNHLFLTIIMMVSQTTYKNFLTAVATTYPFGGIERQGIVAMPLFAIRAVGAEFLLPR
jgi:hypothetical protein